MALAYNRCIIGIPGKEKCFSVTLSGDFFFPILKTSGGELFKLRIPQYNSSSFVQSVYILNFYFFLLKLCIYLVTRCLFCHGNVNELGLKRGAGGLYLPATSRLFRKQGASTSLYEDPC